ncbi:ShlB/FhaC/HecB family hemolysin secretion/activation protein [Trichocoleus sp. FACHB-90]|nr:ShlB/FhaC/HecB family hemolysin secretion/activation protein [Trichocoleus sp. FACHB-90]
MWLYLGLVILTNILMAGTARSQTVDPAIAPNLVTPPPQDTLPPSPSTSPTPPLLPPLLNPLPSPPATTTPEESLDNAPGTINVDRYQVIGSTVFTREDFEKVTYPFTGENITFDQLLQARSAVTELYKNRGYITSGAYIPQNQTIQIDGGVVLIQVIEGGLEGIKVTGTQRLNPNYLQSRLAIATSKPLNKKRLLEALRLLQLNPLIENLSAELSAGTQPGMSLLEVRVKEAKTFLTETAIDNERSPSIGSFERRLQLTEANLLGQGDGVNIAYTNTDGSDNLDVSYELPFNPRNGTLRFSYGTTSSNVIERPFERLDIKSASRYYELTLRQPIIQTATQQSTQELALGLTASRRESETSLLDIPFPLSPGADDRGRTRLSALRFFQEWTQRNSREVIALRSQFSFGLDAFDSTINETAPDSRFFAWRGQGQWFRRLAPDKFLLVRADVQLADRALMPLEQFGLGGQASVRGYRQDILLSDDGIFASAELQLPVYRTSSGQGVLQIVPFVDFGTVWNSSGRAETNSNTLASVGLGLQWRHERLSVRIDWGVPLIELPSRNGTWQENGLYFSVRYNPF